MKSKTFDMDEFIKGSSAQPPPTEEVEAVEAPELDVQKAVVESLAADKAELERDLVQARNDLLQARREVDELKIAISNLSAQFEELKKSVEERNAAFAEKAKAFEGFETREANYIDSIRNLEGSVESLKEALACKERELAEQLEKEFDLQERNPNALALLDRDVDIPDRFPGETRDHVLEVISAARATAEAEGRVRLAQVLEGVLVSNEPNGTLSRKRQEMEKLFVDNGNIVSGEVLEVLRKEGISHKNGEEYLMPSEIIKRNY